MFCSFIGRVFLRGSYITDDLDGAVLDLSGRTFLSLSILSLFLFFCRRIDVACDWPVVVMAIFMIIWLGAPIHPGNKLLGDYLKSIINIYPYPPEKNKNATTKKPGASSKVTKTPLRELFSFNNLIKRK